MGAAPVLTILKGGEELRSVPIEGEAVLGRSEGCVIRLDDRAISRQHAVFTRKGDHVQVEKKSEFAPLKVNGADCTQAVLKEGDVISIGPYLLRLSLHGQQQAPDARPADPKPEPPAESAPPEPETPADASLMGAGMAASPPDPSAEEEPPAEDPMSLASAPLAEPGGEGERTQAGSSPIELRLVVRSGQANVTEYVIRKDVVSIGRGRDCDIVLGDKKASRKNAVITRSGLSCSIQDQGSSNGTYVNGNRIAECELSGGDIVRIGEVELEFLAEQPGYTEQEKGFMPVAEQDTQEGMAPFASAGAEAPMLPPGQALGAESAAFPGAVAPPAGETAASMGISGIAGISGAGSSSGKRKGLMEKFRALPKQRQYIVIGLVIAFGYFFFLDDPPPQRPRPKAAHSQSVGKNKPLTKAFEALTPKEQNFVKAQHQLAFDYYRNKEYDKALFEIEQVFKYVDDYDDSREIERYSKEGKQKLEAMAAEKAKEDAEAAARQKVAGMVNQARDLMDKHAYSDVGDLFSQILALDPENAQVAKWQAKIQQYDEDQRIAAEKRQVQAEINRQAWAIYRDGMNLKKEGKLREAIAALQKVKEVGASERKVRSSADAQIKAIQDELAAELAPILKSGKDAEDNGDFVTAMAAYEKALAIQPDQEQATSGIARLKGILTDRAKALYTEAVLAESYSDFASAKKKFQQCLQTAPKDSIYHDRAERKLARYFKLSDDTSGYSGPMP